LARKVRERSIRHGLLHCGPEVRAETVSTYPRYVCDFQENWRGSMEAGLIINLAVSFSCPPSTCYFQSEVLD
jgi:hypothetical protein